LARSKTRPSIGSTPRLRYGASAGKPQRFRHRAVETGCPGQRLSIDPARTYRVAALAYTVIGADGYPAFKSATNPARNNTDHETFANYIRTHATLTPPPLTRVASLG
jgi:5'-nucleotidase